MAAGAKSRRDNRVSISATLGGMDLASFKHVIVFGGSFDPPHLAHVALPEQVRQQLDAQLVIYVPAGLPPHKNASEQTPASHRLAMLKHALANTSHTFIDECEIDRAASGQPTYMVDTLRHLQTKLAPRATMRLLIGADQMRLFHTWKAPQQIAQLAEPVVMVRPPDTADSLLQSLGDSQAAATWRSRLVDVTQMDISSSEIRQRVAQGKPIEQMVCPAVARYIQTHGLYQHSVT